MVRFSTSNSPRTSPRNASSTSLLSLPLLLFVAAVGSVLLLLVQHNLDSTLLASSLLLLEETTDTSATGGTINREATSTAVQQQDFFSIAQKHGTDKVHGAIGLQKCLKDGVGCQEKMMNSVNPRCRPWGHFYHTMYNKWLGPYSTKDAEPFQFLEIGYYNGHGFDSYMEFLPRAEAHSMEIACLPEGPREEGKWPWGNFAAKNPRYESLLKQDRLHCGDASQFDFLQNIWNNKMSRPDAPPLKVVVDDGAHLAEHMAISLFYWFPKIQPRGVLVMEDIEPTSSANLFRTQVLPQVMKDLHYCGELNFKDDLCFPTIQPLLASVHCEMHICVFERNDEPAVEYTNEKDAMPPKHALDAKQCFAEKRAS